MDNKELTDELIKWSYLHKCHCAECLRAKISELLKEAEKK